MVKKTYKVKGMDCTSCAMVIEADLEDLGIKASCSYTKELLEVEFDESKISEKNIKNIIEKNGYEIKSAQ